MNTEVLVFPPLCFKHGARAKRYWVETAGEGYWLPLLVVVQYGCRSGYGCLESQFVQCAPREVRDYVGRIIPKTDPPERNEC